MLRVVQLKYGTAFKKAFSDPEIFSAFVNDILGIDFHATHVEQERGFSPRFGRVDIKFDLFAEDADKRTLIDIQHIRENETFDRFLYYHLIAQAEQIQTSNEYRFERTVYTLVVLTRQPREEGLRFDVASVDSLARDLEGNRFDFYKHRLVFVNPRCIKPTTPPAVRRWLELIEDSLDEQIDEARYPDPVMQRVLRKIEVDGITPEEAFALKEEASWELAKREARVAGLDEGKRLGLDEGKKLGLDEGKRLGIDEGRLVGQLSEARKAVERVLLRRGLTLSAEQQARLASCQEPSELERWLDQAITAASADEALR